LFILVWFSGQALLRAQAPASDPSGWVGRRVVIAVQGSVPLMDGPRVVVSNAEEPVRVWAVTQVNGGWLYVKAAGSGVQGWVQAG
jgi:hypothetical protein